MAEREYDLRYVGDEDGQGRYITGVGSGHMTEERVRDVARRRGESYRETKKYLIATGVWERWEDRPEPESAEGQERAKPASATPKPESQDDTPAAERPSTAAGHTGATTSTTPGAGTGTKAEPKKS